MKKFRLNNLDNSWIFEGNSEQEAIQQYLDQICPNNPTIKGYAEYCESVGVNSEINMKEIA